MDFVNRRELINEPKQLVWRDVRVERTNGGAWYGAWSKDRMSKQPDSCTLQCKYLALLSALQIRKYAPVGRELLALLVRVGWTEFRAFDGISGSTGLSGLVWPWLNFNGCSEKWINLRGNGKNWVYQVSWKSGTSNYRDLTNYFPSCLSYIRSLLHESSILSRYNSLRFMYIWYSPLK